MARERWRKVPGWPRYRHSSNGRTKGPRGLLKPTPDKDGYLYVTLRAGHAKPRRVGVATLTLEVFAGPRPGGHEACHSREAAGRQDCRLEVLRWDTRKGNEQDKLERWNEIGGRLSPPLTSVFPVTAGLG
jgi:hypothetical protein